MDPRFPALAPQAPIQTRAQTRAVPREAIPFFALPLAEWTVFGALILLLLQT